MTRCIGMVMGLVALSACSKATNTADPPTLTLRRTTVADVQNAKLPKAGDSYGEAVKQLESALGRPHAVNNVRSMWRASDATQCIELTVTVNDEGKVADAFAIPLGEKFAHSAYTKCAADLEETFKGGK